MTPVISIKECLCWDPCYSSQRSVSLLMCLSPDTLGDLKSSYGHTPLVCHVVMRVKERCYSSLLLPLLWWARELTFPFTSCSTQESGPCTSPRQHSRTDPIGRGSDEPPRGRKHGKSGLTPHLRYGGVGGGEKPSPHSFASCGRWASELALRS